MQKKWYHIKLSAIIQNFEKQNGDEDYDYYNCINLRDAIKSYFNGKEETFYTQILPFIIDQALLIEERAKNKYGEQTVPLMPAGKAMKISIPKILFLSMISNNFFCNDKDVINQLTEEELKCNTQRIICFIAFFDFGKRILDSKNNFFNKDIILEKNYIYSRRNK